MKLIPQVIVIVLLAVACDVPTNPPQCTQAQRTVVRSAMGTVTQTSCQMVVVPCPGNHQQC